MAEREVERRRIEAKIGRITGSDGRFLSSDKGIVMDTKTGLEWLAGPGKKGPWKAARDWAASLTVAGGGWRMPTREELKTLCLGGNGRCGMSRLLSTRGYVWTSEERARDSAWAFDFENGKVVSRLKSLGIGYSRGFAVRFRSHFSSRGWLGVGIHMNEEIAECYGIKDKKGVLIVKVFSGSPADKAGIKQKDIVLSINAKKVENAHELINLIADTSVGDTVKIKVLRNGTEKTFQVKITKTASYQPNPIKRK